MTLANAGKQRTPESTLSRAHDRMESAEVLLLLVIKGFLCIQDLIDCIHFWRKEVR